MQDDSFKSYDEDDKGDDVVKKLNVKPQRSNSNNELNTSVRHKFGKSSSSLKSISHISIRDSSPINTPSIIKLTSVSPTLAYSKTPFQDHPSTASQRHGLGMSRSPM